QTSPIAGNRGRLDWVAALASFKAVVREGLEVVFIVIAVGAGRDLIVPASIGAIAACLLVAVIGLVIHRPLARVPENIRASGPSGLREQAGHMTASDFCAAREVISCQA